MNNTKTRIIALIALSFFFSLSGIAFAHSTVAPSETATSKYETFTASVPTEREVPTVGVKLIVPETLDRVTPFVKAGWKINVTKNTDGKVIAIEWTGGSIPAGLKDVFPFTARTGASSTTLVWKIYQTYQGGEVVAWDRDPNGALKPDEQKVANPYSSTNVTSPAPAPIVKEEAPQKDTSLTFALVALALSIVALGVASRKK